VSEGGRPEASAEPSLTEEDRHGFTKGVAEFNAGHFFECHDTLEEVWSGIRGSARDFFQGLIQVSVGFYHHGNGNRGGALTMLDRGLKRLAKYPDRYCGLELARLRREVGEWRARIEAGESFPEDPTGLPKYRLDPAPPDANSG
jgi:predicted metal-dependent hydrolase